MRLYYPDAIQGKYIDIVDPKIEDVEEALRGIDNKNRPEVTLYIFPGYLKVSVDDSNQRVLVCYCQTNPNQGDCTEKCPTDTSLTQRHSELVSFTAANGEGFHAKLSQTVTRDVALEIVLYIYQHESAPEFVTWTDSRFW